MISIRNYVIGAMLVLAGHSAHAVLGRVADPRNLEVIVSSQNERCQQLTLIVVDTLNKGVFGPSQLGWRRVTPAIKTWSKCPMSERVNQQNVARVKAQIEAKLKRAIAQKRMVTIESNGNVVLMNKHFSGDRVIARTSTVSGSSSRVHPSDSFVDLEPEYHH